MLGELEEPKHGGAVKQIVMLGIKFVNIAFKGETYIYILIKSDVFTFK